MLSFYRITILLALVQVAFSIPLGLQYDAQPNGDATRKNKERIDGATALANTQITKMKEGFDKAKSGNAKAKALYEAAFGKAGTNSDMDKVGQTITALQTGTMSVKLAAHPFTKGEYASVPWTQQKKNSPWVPGPARFGKKFHDELDANGRAGTVIHEATHQLKGTGDEVHKTTGKIIRAPEDNADAHASKTGYTSNPNMHKTAAEVAKDKEYTAVRNKASNMHDNAESYAVFASLCSQPGALSRRDVHLFNRALADGDDDQLEILARRNSCKLPPRKKTAAKTPAAKGASTKAASSKLRTAAGKVSKTSKVANALKKTRTTKSSLKSGNRALKGVRSAKILKAKSSASKVAKGGRTSKKLTAKATRGKVAGARKLAKATRPSKIAKSRSAKTSRGRVARKSSAGSRTKKLSTKTKAPARKAAGVRKSAAHAKKGAAKGRVGKVASRKVAGGRKPAVRAKGGVKARAGKAAGTRKAGVHPKKTVAKARGGKTASRKAPAARKAPKSAKKVLSKSKSRVGKVAARKAVHSAKIAKGRPAARGKAVHTRKVAAKKPVRATKPRSGKVAPKRAVAKGKAPKPKANRPSVKAPKGRVAPKVKSPAKTRAPVKAKAAAKVAPKATPKGKKH